MRVEGYLLQQLAELELNDDREPQLIEVLPCFHRRYLWVIEDHRALRGVGVGGWGLGVGVWGLGVGGGRGRGAEGLQ